LRPDLLDGVEVAPETFRPTGVRNPVLSISIRPLIGIVQLLQGREASARRSSG